MTITVVASNDVVNRVAASLRIAGAGNQLTVPLLAQALRRAAHILAPCPRHELQSAVRKSVTGLGISAEDLEKLVEDTTEALLVYGDILEMRPLQDDPWRESPIVLRPAPPSFVARQDGTAVIVGIAGDAITPFAEEMNARVAFHGPLRLLAPQPEEDLPQTLRELGLLELSEAAWLRLPSMEPANACMAKWQQELAAAPLCEAAISGLRIISPTSKASFYRDRWIEPTSEYTGMHVARRPQKYGADIWCLVDLENGKPVRFIDLLSRGDRLRPCDLAWRIQMAIDAQAGSPQRFRVRSGDSQSFIDFFSPLPSWAERKLAIVGERVDPHRALLSFVMPPAAIKDEVEFLRQRLWLEPEP